MIDENSRWRRSIVTISLDLQGNISRRAWLDTIKPRASRNLQGARAYEVREGDTWVSLSFKIYGDSALWWVLAEYNDVVDPFAELVPGTTLVIPSNDVVFFDELDFEVPETREGVN